jgi:phage major head subunit gpT-like protein
MIISQPNLDALRLTLSMVFQKAYDSTPTFYDRIATTLPSSTSSTRYGWLAQQVLLREWVGPRVALNLAERTHVVVNRKFEGTIQIDRDQLEDDNLGMYSSALVPQLAQAAKKHPDQLIKTLLQSNPVGFDGVTLFHDAHPTFDAAGTTYDNNFALALDATGFNTVWSTMASYTGEDGQPLGIMGGLLIVPPQLKKPALEVVNATLVAGASGGYTNVLQGWADVLVVPELANQPDVWYLADVSKPIKPFGWQVRRSPEFVSRDSLTDPKVFEQEQFTYGTSYRGEVFHTLPFLIAKSDAP